MNSFNQHISAIIFVTLMSAFFLIRAEFIHGAEQDDPWQKLREVIDKPAPEKEKKSAPVAKEEDDPWVKLRAIYLPFTEEEEAAAVTDKSAGKKVASGLHAALDPHASFIEEAAQRFDIPVEIISAVIMVESGGNAKAKAKTSSASGLMQTIKATFQEARKGLNKEGITIIDNPFEPRSSVMAGTWYLNRMYKMAKADRPDTIKDRTQIGSWKYPLEYYYAGPGHGVKREPVVIIYSGGKKVKIDKPAYSGKVLKWAGILRENA